MLLTKVPLAVVALARVPLALVLLAVVLLAAVALALVPGSRSQSLRKHPQRKDRPPASNRPGRSPRLSRPGAGCGLPLLVIHSIRVGAIYLT